MKRIFLLIIGLSIGAIAFAEKNQTKINELKWHALVGDFNSPEEIKAALNEQNKIDVNSFIINNESSIVLSTIIETQGDNSSRFFLEMENKSTFPRILIDGLPISNQRQDASFTAEISISEGKEEFLLTLILDSGKLQSNTRLSDYFDGIYFSTVTGISIAWCEPLKDPFFGGYMLEVHIWNTGTKDIDGKLLARISATNTFELVAENNNCAFSRNNSEAVIDINFPDAKEKLKAGKYFVEVVMVDKEKNEEMVDKLTTNVTFN